jgi:hypothetical protein
VEITDSNDADERMTLTQRKADILAEKKEKFVSRINKKTPNTTKNIRERKHQGSNTVQEREICYS